MQFTIIRDRNGLNTNAVLTVNTIDAVFTCGAGVTFITFFTLFALGAGISFITFVTLFALSASIAFVTFFTLGTGDDTYILHAAICISQQ